jgi:hypothetical protein
MRVRVLLGFTQADKAKSSCNLSAFTGRQAAIRRYKNEKYQQQSVPKTT